MAALQEVIYKNLGEYINKQRRDIKINCRMILENVVYSNLFDNSKKESQIEIKELNRNGLITIH